MAQGFFNEVYKLVKRIPRGRVATYGQIAAILGKPRAARLVGWACPVLKHRCSIGFYSHKHLAMINLELTNKYKNF